MRQYILILLLSAILGCGQGSVPLEAPHPNGSLPKLLSLPHLPRPIVIPLGSIERAARIRQTLATDEAWLQIALGKHHSSLFVLTRDTFKITKLKARASLEADAERLLRLLSGKSSAADAIEIERLSRRLGHELLGDVERDIRGRRLSIVADGKLALLPFALLSLSDDGDWNPLLKDFEIRYPHFVPPAPPRRPIEGSVAVVADPVLDAQDSRLPNTRTETTQEGAPTRAAKDLGGFKRLMGTLLEARNTLRRAPGPSFLATGFEANRELVLSDRLVPFQILHFATHGVIHAEDPEQSGLILSRYDSERRAIPGFLHAVDLADLKLQAELVVLSACQTAVRSRGDAMAGLAHGLVRNGTPSVVGSLWQSDDAGSVDLMDRFYHHLWAAPELDAPSALRLAQLDLLEDSQWAAPYYWAPWIVVTAAPG